MAFEAYGLGGATGMWAVNWIVFWGVVIFNTLVVSDAQLPPEIGEHLQRTEVGGSGTGERFDLRTFTDRVGLRAGVDLGWLTSRVGRSQPGQCDGPTRQAPVKSRPDRTFAPSDRRVPATSETPLVQESGGEDCRGRTYAGAARNAADVRA